MKVLPDMVYPTNPDRSIPCTNLRWTMRYNITSGKNKRMEAVLEIAAS